MEKIKPIKVYNLVDENGIKLQLRLGYVQGERFFHENAGWRWSFFGTKIPMPVRSRTWFNGFPEKIMLDWLKANGWYPETCVDLGNGKAIVYDLPEAPEETETVYFITSEDDSPNAYVRSDMVTAIRVRDALNANDCGDVYRIYKGTEV